MAVVVDGKRVGSLHAEAPGALIPRSARDVPHLLGEARDVEVLERVDIDAIRARLLAAQREAEALDMVVGVLDAELTAETRQLCVEAAEELCADEQVAEAMAAVLCGMAGTLFLVVWAALLVLTGIEVFLAYIHTPLVIMLTVLMGLSVIKAGLIIAYFMHLKYEKFSLFLVLFPMLVFCIMMLFVFMPDAQRALDFRPR